MLKNDIQSLSSQNPHICIIILYLSSLVAIIAPSRHAHKPPHPFSVIGMSFLQDTRGFLIPSTRLRPSSHHCLPILYNMIMSSVFSVMIKC